MKPSVLYKFSTCILLFTGITIFSCQNRQIEVLDIALKLKNNQCRIQEISHFVDSSWTKSIKELEAYLPAQLPNQERKNILNLKNADLIRMFESYDDFHPKGHELVDSMEQLDVVWAGRLRELSIENQTLTMMLDSLFSTFENSEEIDHLYEEVESIRSSSCDNQSNNQ